MFRAGPATAAGSAPASALPEVDAQDGAVS